MSEHCEVNALSLGEESFNVHAQVQAKESAVNECDIPLPPVVD